MPSAPKICSVVAADGGDGFCVAGGVRGVDENAFFASPGRCLRPPRRCCRLDPRRSRRDGQWESCEGRGAELAIDGVEGLDVAVGAGGEHCDGADTAVSAALVVVASHRRCSWESRAMATGDVRPVLGPVIVLIGGESPLLPGGKIRIAALFKCPPPPSDVA